MIAATSTPLPVSASSISSASQAIGVDDPLSRGAQNGSPAGFQESALPLDMVQEPIIVVAHDRRVRMSSETDPHSLYSFCRKWVQNRPAEDEELGFAPPIPSVLPKPLPAQQPGPETDATEAHDTVKSSTGVNSEGIAPSKLTPKELLRAHVHDFKLVRKRKREEWRRRVKRYKPRLCLIFPPGAAAVAHKKDESKADPEKQTQ